MKTFEYWRERSSGLIFAIAFEDGVVVGSCGPVDHGDLDTDLLPRHDYDAGRAAWIEAHRAEFDLYRLPAPV